MSISVLLGRDQDQVAFTVLQGLPNVIQID